MVSRDESTSNRFDTSAPLEQTAELATSVRCLTHTIYNIPDFYSYQFGYFQLKQILAIIPKVSSLSTEAIGKDEIYDSSAMFISYLIQGNNIKYGDGTNSISDLYLDFGVIGVVIGFFLFGIFIKTGENALMYGTRSMLLFLSILVYFANSITIARSSILFQIQVIFQTYLIIVLNYHLQKKYIQKR